MANHRQTGGPYLAGVELGGTKCICVLADTSGAIFARERVATGHPSETLSRIETVLHGWRREHDIAAIGIASFGPLDTDPASANYGQLLATPKPGWAGADLRRLLWDIPFLIDTDVNGAALAEGVWGAARDLRSWCYITIGTGVGVAPIIDRRPVLGLGHAEAGHMIVPSPQPGWAGSCSFHKGCVEGFVSGPALEARCGQPASDIPDSDDIWDDVAQIVATLCHNLAVTVVPERIMLGGSVAINRPYLLEVIRAKLNASLAGYAHGARIALMPEFLVTAKLGEDAGPAGAIRLAQLALATSAP